MREDCKFVLSFLLSFFSFFSSSANALLACVLILLPLFPPRMLWQSRWKRVGKPDWEEGLSNWFGSTPSERHPLPLYPRHEEKRGGFSTVNVTSFKKEGLSKESGESPTLVFLVLCLVLGLAKSSTKSLNDLETHSTEVFLISWCDRDFIRVCPPSSPTRHRLCYLRHHTRRRPPQTNDYRKQ